MAQLYTDVYDANMQVVRQNVFPRLYAMSNTVSSKILGSIEKHQITKTPGGSDFRAPIEVGNAAQFGAFSLAGGSLGLGGSYNLQQLVQTTFPVKLGFQINADASIGTANAKISAANAFKKSMKDAMPLVQDYDDRSFFNITGSQGVIAVSTALATATYTLDTNFGANLLSPLQVVEVLDSTLATNKTLAAGVSPDNLPYITAWDPIARTVTLANIAGLTGGNALASGDRLAFQGVGSTATWMNGLYYVNDAATSGTYLGLNRATYPQIAATNYAANGTITPQMGILMKHRIMLRYGKLPTSLIGIINVAQHAGIINTGINISTWYRSNKAQEKPLDIAPAVEDVVDFCGIPTHLSTHQNQSRVDYVNKADWGRVWFGNTNQWDFWQNQAGQKVFSLISSNGAPAASELFYMWAAYNYYNVNPGAGGYISGLTLPSGY